MTPQKIRYKVRVEDDRNSKPLPHEKATAEILAKHFKSDVIFLRRAFCATPDIYVLKTNARWELKSPLGGGKRTIQNNLRGASRQSENIIIDLSRSKLNAKQGISRVNEFLNSGPTKIKRLKIITKSKKIIDIKG
ncbi:hypothetical protein IJH02_00900 [Candidatus Saccharibacteria bacterium]|nr:hypothetical protein [Candidatus Saccharibacteria bacterium]